MISSLIEYSHFKLFNFFSKAVYVLILVAQLFLKAIPFVYVEHLVILCLLFLIQNLFVVICDGLLKPYNLLVLIDKLLTLLFNCVFGTLLKFSELSHSQLVVARELLNFLLPFH